MRGIALPWPVTLTMPSGLEIPSNLGSPIGWTAFTMHGTSLATVFSWYREFQRGVASVRLYLQAKGMALRHRYGGLACRFECLGISLRNRPELPVLPCPGSGCSLGAHLAS